KAMLHQQAFRCVNLRFDPFPNGPETLHFIPRPSAEYISEPSGVTKEARQGGNPTGERDDDPHAFLQITLGVSTKILGDECEDRGGRSVDSGHGHPPA